MGTESERLGTEPIKKLLFRLSVPSIIGLILSATYNLVDTIFVGGLGVDAISALSISFPIQLGLFAMASGTGIGVSSIISRSLGNSDKKTATYAAGNVLLIAFFYSIGSAIIGLFFTEQLISLFINDPTVSSLAVSYTRIILIGSFFLFLNVVINDILRGQGNIILPTVVIVISSFINIILDPILIFGMFDFPALGVEGAAIATVFSRAIGFLFVLMMFFTPKNELRVNISSLIPNSEIYKKIYQVGLPTIIIQIAASLSLIAINKILEGISIMAIAIYGVFFKISSFSTMPVYGISQGFVPLVGYNFGAKKFDRIRKAFFLAGGAAFLISFITFLALQLFPSEIISVFNNDPMFVEMGSEAFRILSILFFIVGPAVILIGFFQGVGDANRALFILAIRQFIVFIPLFYYLGVSYGHPLMWYAFPISDIAAVVAAFILCFDYLKYLKLNWYDRSTKLKYDK